MEKNHAACYYKKEITLRAAGITFGRTDSAAARRKKNRRRVYVSALDSAKREKK